MSILKNSKRLNLFPEFRSDGLREYVIENDNLYLLYHSHKEQNVKHKIRCIKRLDGFKIYAEASESVMKTTYYYILDLKTKEVFGTAYDTAIMGSYLPKILDEIKTLLYGKPEIDKEAADRLTSCW